MSNGKIWRPYPDGKCRWSRVCAICGKKFVSRSPRAIYCGLRKCKLAGSRKTQRRLRTKRGPRAPRVRFPDPKAS